MNRNRYKALVRFGIIKEKPMSDWKINPNRPCPCGSDLPSWWAKDARGIEIARVCEACETEKLKGYTHEVLTNPNYEADEAIEPEDY